MKNVCAIVLAPIHGLLRFRQRKGFGVQSPFAQSFLQDVVYEHHSYYAYQSLPSAYADSPQGGASYSPKQLRFLFRLANFCQPPVIWLPAESAEALQLWVKAGCQSAGLRTYRDEAELQVLLSTFQSKGRVLVDHLQRYGDFLLEMLPKLDGDVVVAIRGVNRCNSDGKFWQRLVAMPQSTVSFDLLTYGILFLNPRFSKQHYKLYL